MVNHVVLIGKIGSDPKVFTDNYGTVRVYLSVGLSENYRDRGSLEWKHKLNWIPCTVTSENLIEKAKLLRKGNTLHVYGRFNIFKKVDQNKIEQQYVNIQVVHFSLLSSNAKEEVFLSDGYGEF